MTTFLVHRSDNALSAARAAEGLLESRPVEHNVILSVLRDRMARPEPGRYWWISESGVVRGLALQSPLTFAATLTPMPVDAVGSLVGAVAAEAPDLPGVIGDAATAAAFVGAWTERLATSARPIEGQRVYRLDTVRPPRAVDGRLRMATPSDIGRSVEWFDAFHAEIDAARVVHGVAELIERRTQAGEIWLWDLDGEVVSAAMIGRPIAGAARLSFVYTPPAERGRGYAAAAVASLCTAAMGADAPFGRVDTCLLHTQLHNATSNALYRRIGFRAVADLTSYELDPRPGAATI